MSHYAQTQYRPNDEFDSFYHSMLFRKGDSILDIACSTGNFAIQDKQHIIGIDTDKKAIAIARKRGVRAIYHDARGKMPFKDGSFPHIHCRHLLEHLDDPLPFMKDIHRMLKKGGRLVLITDKMSKIFWDDYTHKRPFTKTSLRQLAYDAGFRDFSIHDFPSAGVPLLGRLHSWKLITPKAAKKAYVSYATLFLGKSLLLEAIK
jgi:ubiquinone/menaquinone biosynthesis C-methylase UbiE